MGSHQLKLEALGIDLRKLKGNHIDTTCPKCSHTRKKKNDPCLSVTIDEGLYNCHHCSWSGTIKDYNPIKEYFKPVYDNKTELTRKVLDYFFKRSISPKTLLKMKVGEGVEWMPRVNAEVNTIKLNYFRDGELINTKFRDAEKNFKLVKDAELIFYNLDAIKESDWCLITEGEIDALSWIEVGIDEVVSVPNGASKGNQKLEYLDNCYQYFINKAKIIIATDNDEAGKSLREELSRRLGVDKCYWIDFGDCKDSNEFLIKYMSDGLKSLLESPKEFSIEGVFNIEDVWSDLQDVYENGLPQGYKTGDSQFDEYLGVMPGELTMVTGIPGHGKSIYLDQIALGLCLNSDFRFAICSPESYPVHFYYARLIKRLLGKKFSKYKITQDELLEVRDWIKERFNLIAPPKGYNLDEILEKARMLILKKGIKGLIIDPWNRIEANIPSNYNERKWINEQLDKIIRFNQVNRVHTFLVAHPTKMSKEKNGINYIVPNLYSISGSGDFFNMTQNGFTVFKNEASKETEVHIQKVKWEHLGKIGQLRYHYCDENARFVAQGENALLNWLKPEIVESNVLQLQPNTNFYDKEKEGELPW